MTANFLGIGLSTVSKTLREIHFTVLFISTYIGLELVKSPKKRWRLELAATRFRAKFEFSQAIELEMK